MNIGIKQKTLVLIFSSFFAVTSQAADVTLSGTSFDVVYDDALSGLFNTPALVGDTVFFTPVSFSAESLNGAGFDTANSTINLRRLPKNGLTIDSLSLVERGEYKLRGDNSFVNVGGRSRVFALANTSMEETSAITATGALTINDGVNHSWQSESFIQLIDSAWQGESLNYTIENLLEAYTDPADTGPKLAYIEKTFAGSSISLVVTTVPETDTYAMLVAGLGVVGFALRMKKSV